MFPHYFPIMIHWQPQLVADNMEFEALGLSWDADIVLEIHVMTFIHKLPQCNSYI